MKLYKEHRSLYRLKGFLELYLCMRLLSLDVSSYFFIEIVIRGNGFTDEMGESRATKARNKLFGHLDRRVHTIQLNYLLALVNTQVSQ